MDLVVVVVFVVVDGVDDVVETQSWGALLVA